MEVFKLLLMCFLAGMAGTCTHVANTTSMKVAIQVFCLSTSWELHVWSGFFIYLFFMLKYQFCRLGTINTGLWKLFKCDVAITWHIQNIHTVCVSMQQVGGLQEFRRCLLFGAKKGQSFSLSYLYKQDCDSCDLFTLWDSDHWFCSSCIWEVGDKPLYFAWRSLPTSMYKYELSFGGVCVAAKPKGIVVGNAVHLWLHLGERMTMNWVNQNGWKRCTNLMQHCLSVWEMFIQWW